MALIKCPECGKEVSDKATSCPNCGYELSKQNQGESTTPRSSNKTIAIIIAVVVLAAAAVGCWAIFGSKTEDATKTTETTEETIENVSTEEPELALQISDFVFTSPIEWRGVSQQSISLAADDVNIVEKLKSLGFEVTKQETKTFEGEGGEPIEATITNLKKSGCEIETNGREVTITFNNEASANQFMDGVKEMGFKKDFESPDGRQDYCWIYKDEYNNEHPQNDCGDVFVSLKGNEVSIYTAMP